MRIVRQVGIALTILSFSILIFAIMSQEKRIDGIVNEKASFQELNTAYERYISLLFSEPVDIEESLYVTRLCSLDSALLCVIIPEGICEACAVDMLYVMKDMGVDFNDSMVLVDRTFSHVRELARSMGFRSVGTLPDTEIVRSILIIGDRPQDSKKIVMRFNDGDAPILKLFIQRLRAK